MKHLRAGAIWWALASAAWLLGTGTAGIRAYAAVEQPDRPAVAYLPGKPVEPREPVERRTAFGVGPDERARYEVDGASKRNQISFTSKAPRETIVGRTSEASGYLEFNPRKLDQAEGKFTVAWSSIDTGSPRRNEHMRSAPWVDAEAHPDIEFTVTGIDKVRPEPNTDKKVKARLAGRMSINGKSATMRVPVTLAYVVGGETEDGREIREGVGVRSTFKLALADFDIHGRGVGQSVAREVQVKVSLFLAMKKKGADEADKQEENEPAKEKKSRKKKKKTDRKKAKDDDDQGGG